MPFAQTQLESPFRKITDDFEVREAFEDPAISTNEFRALIKDKTGELVGHGVSEEYFEKFKERLSKFHSKAWIFKHLFDLILKLKGLGSPDSSARWRSLAVSYSESKRGLSELKKLKEILERSRKLKTPSKTFGLNIPNELISALVAQGINLKRDKRRGSRGSVKFKFRTGGSSSSSKTGWIRLSEI